MYFKIKAEPINNVCDDSATCVHKDTTNNLHQCSQCNFTTNTNSSLEMHNLIHTGEKPFHCTMCPYEAKRKLHLQEQFTKYTNLHPFQHVFCQKCFTTKQIRRKHQLIHTGEKPYMCSQCDFRARYTETLSNHV
ncbi:hypothetical protein FQA39_LY18230 [Lamprigera yunnana]|nr:hypothetical protein FQA39_LY18230 [Lamprigera yunnana]